MEDNQRMRELRKVQLSQLELIRLFVDICEEEHLTYYMLGGTMLGAVRDKGYIPWDDDADFGMPRPDYERFLDAAPAHVFGNYRLGTHKNQEENDYYFISRLYNDELKVQICDSFEDRIESPYIDIFPLDGMPSNTIQRWVQEIRLMYRRLIYKFSAFDYVSIVLPDRPWYEKALIQLGKILPRRLFSWEKEWQKMDKAAKRYSYYECSYVINAMGGHKLKEMHLKSVFSEGDLYEFEGMRLRGPKDYDTYLKQLYGEQYMAPPPVDERFRHQIFLISGEKSGRNETLSGDSLDELGKKCE